MVTELRLRATLTGTALLLSLATLTACPRAPQARDSARAVAVVNGHPIPAVELRRELWRLHGRPEAVDAARVPLAEALLEQMVDQALLLQAAQKAGVEVSPRELEAAWEAAQAGYRKHDFMATLYAQMLTPELMRKRLHEQLLIEEFLKARARELPRISDEQVARHYQENQARYKMPAQVRARQVVVRTAEEAALIKKRLDRGEDFEKVAREHSVAPERERGGDLGFFAQGVMPEVFDKVCFTLEPGQISDVVPSEYGHHVFQVTERRPEQSQPLEAVGGDIRDALRQRQVEEAEARLLQELRTKATLVKDRDALLWAADAVAAPDGGV
ncbi:MAG: peptidyl-prolyl cis-trans isomerase [Myxococcota bacterium]